MKKIILMAALVAAASAATAADFGVRAGRSLGNDINAVGFTLANKNAQGVGVEGAIDRSTTGSVSTNRYSVLGTYDIKKLGDATMTAKAGAAFIDPSAVGSENGSALVGGLGLTVPLTARTAFTLDYAYQRGQERVRSFNGSSVVAGVKYTF